MLKRLTNSGIAFAALAVFYQVYVLMLVPFVEPAGAAPIQMQPRTLEDLAKPPDSLLRYEPLLKAYFPPDHWCFHVLPRVIENGQTLIVFDRYDQNDSGVLRIPRCAIVFFPSPRDTGGDPPRDAIVLEPSDGATMQMDQTIGQKFGSMGRMQFGQLLGSVTVRSDMKEEGPQDDLLVKTKDLYMNEDFLRTPETVTIDMGASHARGRGFEVHFYKAEKTAGGVGATFLGKLEKLVVLSEVAGEYVPNKPGPSEKPPVVKTTADGKEIHELSDDPTSIRCGGAFTFDFNSRVATFIDDVHVQQLRPGGVLDELTANELTCYFAEIREWGGDVTPTRNDEKPAVGKIKLQPATIEAQGLPDAPVLLNAPSQQAVARGDRLRIELLQRQVSLMGHDEVSLVFHGTEVHAPVVRYELPPKDSKQTLGIMNASGGSGWLRSAPNPTRPNEMLEVSWKDSMQLVRIEGQPVLRLDGRPKVSMLRMGTLWADQLEIYLRENAVEKSATTRADDLGGMPASVSAERVVAVGHVGVQTAELDARVNKLDLEITDPQAAVGGVGGVNSGPAVGGVVSTGGSGTGGGQRPTPPSMFDRNRGGASGRSYNISGSVLHLDAVMRDKKPEVTGIHIDGSVVFQETTQNTSGEPPMRILTDHLAVSDADTPQAKIDIRGGPVGEGLAEISARGTVIQAPALKVNRGTSHAEINSPGEVQLMMTKDASGKLLTTPQPLHITWRDSMMLDRDHITFLGDVRVRHPDGWMRTSRLVAVLTQPVQFDGASGAKNADVAQLECWEHALAEFDQRDPSTGAVTSHQRMELESLVVNQITGDLRGDGPGRIDSVHLSKGDGAWKIMPEAIGPKGEMPAPVEQDVAPEAPKLKHLNVEFVRGVEGNIHTNLIRVFGDVHTIYGPIDAWDQRLTMSAGGSPGPGTFWITCESLQVSDSVLARQQHSSPDGRKKAFGLVEMICEGAVTIEGSDAKHSPFTLRGNRASFDQAKSMFILSGDSRNLAVVTFQKTPGGPFEDQSAEKFYYWQKTGELKVEGYTKFEFNQFDKQ